VLKEGITDYARH